MGTFNPIFYYNMITQGFNASDKLIAYYPFNANANDFSGKGYNGIGFTGVTFPIGKVANAVFFGTTTANTAGTVPDNDDFSFTNNIVDLPFTISCWVNVTVFSGSRNSIIQKRSGYGSGAEEWQFSILPNGQVVFEKISNNNTSILQSIRSDVGAIPLNTWKHIVITNLNSGTTGLKMYINGVQTTTLATNTNSYTRMINTSSNVIIGSGASSHKHRGLLDEMYIWKNRELTAAEVLDIYNKGNSGVPLI